MKAQRWRLMPELVLKGIHSLAASQKKNGQERGVCFKTTQKGGREMTDRMPQHFHTMCEPNSPKMKGDFPKFCSETALEKKSPGLVGSLALY